MHRLHLAALALLLGCPTAAPTDDDDTASVPVGQGVELSAPKRNLILLSIDTARRDSFGRYGGGDTTPFLDDLMSESLVLDAQQSSGAFTAPAFFSVFSGRTPVDMGFIVAEGPSGISTPDLDQLRWGAGFLQDAGFWGGMVNSNPLLDGYFADLVRRNDSYVFAAPDAARPSVFADATEVTEQGLLLAEQCLAQDRPCLLHVHYMDPHLPLAPPQQDLDALGFGAPPIDVSRYIDVTQFITDDNGLVEIIEGLDALSPPEREQAELWLRRAYDASLHYADRELARLWAGLDALGLLDDALVLGFTDHGERLGEDGLWGHGARASAIEQDTVAFFWAPDITPGAHPHPTGLIDLLPTLLSPSVLDIAVPSAWQQFTQSMTGLPIGAAAADRPVFGYASLGAGTAGNVSVRVRDRTLVYTWTGDVEYFHDDVDPTEQDDRFDPDDPEVLALWEHIRADLPRIQAAVPDLPPPVLPPGLP